jgi:sporulation protein YlmC with PRC-barrel domain
MEEMNINSDETQRLIASDKVEGTAVYNGKGDRLGSIRNFMVDKVSGEVEYAVLSFGGFMGMGTDSYPLPWDVLDYDTGQGGYVVDLDKDMLDQAPHYRADQTPSFNAAYGQEIRNYYAPLT